MAAAEQAVQDEEQQSAAELKRLMGTGIAEDWRFHPITTSDWESAIVWELPSPPLPVSDEMQQEINQSPPIRRFNQPETRFILPNYDLETGEWEAEIIWDEAQAAMLPLPAVQINLNDPNIVVEVAHEGKQGYLSRIAAQKRRKAAGSKGDKILKKEESKKRSSSSAAKQSATETAAALRSAAADKQSLTLDKFNLSNDRYYEIHKTAKSGLVRQEFGKASVQHSLPALRLSLPFFKVNMSKSDLRAFHRPPLKLISDEMFQFMRLRRFQKSRLRGKQITEILKSPKDITLRDNCPYVLFEYSEEYPPLLSNGGMGSLIMNYYRKKDEKDSFIPKVNLGALSILEQVDASPFFGFGDVQPGQLFQAIKNNLYIAPIFKQELQNDDFLLIRYTYKDSTKYFLRDIPRVFTVGQTFPLTLVHPPQSRKMKVYVRDRLKVTAFRRFLKKGRHIRFPLKRMLNSFHRYHEQSIRKHLRDCFELQGGTFSDNKWLVMRRDAVIPPDEEMFKLVTPEMTCVFESLRVGQQRLADAGYGTGEIQMEDDADQDGESILDDEVQLAPWNTTKNFILATQAKGMIKVYGPGDPTGRGEGFSFFRASMKKMFVRRGTTRAELEAYQQSQEKFGHKFSISDQQKHYKEEINRVWDAQIRSLSSVAELEFDEREAQAGDLLMEGDGGGGGGGQESATDLRDMMQMFEGVGDSSTVGQSQSGGRYSRASSPAPSSQHPASTISRLMAADDTTMETGSVDSSSRMTGGRAKALLIRRKVTNDRGMEEWQEEAVFDYRIINAYMKQKRIMEISAANPEDDEETRKRRLIEQLRMLKRQTGRSLTIPKMSQSNRKCRSCGQVRCKVDKL
jgi:transcription initiation factor TFIID subunit 1